MTLGFRVSDDDEVDLRKRLFTANKPEKERKRERERESQGRDITVLSQVIRTIIHRSSRLSRKSLSWLAYYAVVSLMSIETSHPPSANYDNVYPPSALISFHPVSFPKLIRNLWFSISINFSDNRTNWNRRLISEPSSKSLTREKYMLQWWIIKCTCYFIAGVSRYKICRSLQYTRNNWQVRKSSGLIMRLRITWIRYTSDTKNTRVFQGYVRRT